MNVLKRIAGILWIVAGPLAIYYIVRTAIEEINKKPVIDTKIQWAVFVIVFIPIAIGIMIFGVYAIKGQYDHLPDRSADIAD
jgi:hypothetical protein